MKHISSDQWGFRKI